MSAGRERKCVAKRKIRHSENNERRSEDRAKARGRE